MVRFLLLDVFDDDAGDGLASLCMIVQISLLIFVGGFVSMALIEVLDDAAGVTDALLVDGTPDEVIVAGGNDAIADFIG